MKLPSLAHTALVTLLGVGAVACGTASDASSESASTASTWTCGKQDVPGGQVTQCSQALVLDESISMIDTETCEGITDDPESCSVYECNAGEAGCPSTTATTGAAPADGSGTTDTTSTTDTGTTGSGSGSTDATGAQTNLGGSDTTTTTPTKPGQGNAKKADSAGTGSTGTGASDTTGSLSNPGGADSSSKPGQGNAKKSSTPAECSYVDSCAAGSSDASSADSNGNSGSSTSSSSDSKTSTHYKCVKNKKGDVSCSSAPTCVAGSHASACGACVPDGETDDCKKTTEGGCWVTGGGFIQGPNLVTGAAPDGHDSFGGNAKPMKSGRIQGHWNHVDHGTGNHAKGIPSYIVCRHLDEPGPGGPGAKKGFIMNQVYFGGPAQWRVAADGTWASGYWFDVVAKDHGEPGSVPNVKNGFTPDTYHFTIRKMDDAAAQASGTKVYETKETLDGGNIQMHPPVGGHPYTPGKLPEWVSLEP